MCVYDFDAEVPTIQYDYAYGDGGGVLTVDGERVVPGDIPWLFVNGPYGHTVTIRLDSQERTQLARVRRLNAHAEWLKYWHRRIEPRIYDLEGETVSDLRHGQWTYHLKNGAKYLDAEYKLGKRHGDWITYYPNRRIRSKRHFEDGKPVGTWTYFDENGTILGTIEFQNGADPGPGDFAGYDGFGGSERVTGASYEWGRGESVFVINGNTVPRPALAADVLQPSGGSATWHE